MVLALTGTPLENRLEELSTLFDLVLPGYFPAEKTFRDLFIDPIEKTGDEKQKKLLKKMVAPFVLRRKKKEVLKDLPDKTEELIYCDLAQEQKALYLQLARKEKSRLLQELQDEKNEQAVLHVFALLGKLKQLCDHPALLFPKLAHLASGKWELFVEILQEALASDFKVVVFSQYLGMLDLIENYLKKHNLKYAKLTGSTLKRFEEVQKFQTDPECRVFIGSLLASGVGIDLTAGSLSTMTAGGIRPKRTRPPTGFTALAKAGGCRSLSW
jgi:SNF2 family DNA or RNA helicase